MKLFLSSQKYRSDPGSGKNLFPEPGVQKAPDPGSWIRIRNTVIIKQHPTPHRSRPEEKRFQRTNKGAQEAFTANLEYTYQRRFARPRERLAAESNSKISHRMFQGAKHEICKNAFPQHSKICCEKAQKAYYSAKKISFDSSYP